MSTESPPRPAATVALTCVTLVAFASNSLLCRLALGREVTDPVTFTTVRIISGALVLWLLTRAQGEAPAGSWASGLALYAYATAFSLAYVTLGAATGALLLFGAVQATMIASALAGGERPRALQALGIALALCGLGYLLAPGVTAPDPAGAALMSAAGVAWGVYSLHGRGVPRPTATTAGNFLRATPPALAMGLVSVAAGRAHVEPAGLALAVASGAAASGLGYAVWYRALRGHTTTTAAVVQLAVPVIAALGAALLLDERPTLRLAIAGSLVLGGILAATLGKRS